MIRSIATMALAAVLLAGCGGSDEKPAAEKATTRPTPTLKVSDETTCKQLFNGREPLKAAAAIATKFDDGTTEGLDSTEVREVAAALSDIEGRASEELAPSLHVMVDKVNTLADLIDEPQNKMVTLSDFQAAGYEITGVCEQYPSAVAGS